MPLRFCAESEVGGEGVGRVLLEEGGGDGGNFAVIRELGEDVGSLFSVGADLGMKKNAKAEVAGRGADAQKGCCRLLINESVFMTDGLEEGRNRFKRVEAAAGQADGKAVAGEEGVEEVGGVEQLKEGRWWLFRPP